MKSAVALVLIGALVTPSLAAAQPDDVVWSSVHQLAPGKQLMVTREGEPSHAARFIQADDTELKALNVSGPDVPPAAAKALNRIASEQPDQLSRVTPGRTLRINDDMTLSASGLFAGSRKIADYDRVIERISRADVETGVVRLEMPRRMPAGQQVLITLGVIVATPIVIFVAMCATHRCD